MDGNELRAIRKTVAMTQHELAERVGVSRKTIVGWEGSDGALDEAVALQVRKVTGQIRVIENSFRVEPTLKETYAVVSRRIRDLPASWAASYFHGETMLRGEFARRDHAYRWCAALQMSTNPRDTRRLARDRASKAALVTDTSAVTYRLTERPGEAEEA